MGQDGNSSTANFVSGMMKTVPPLNDLFNMAGLNLPEYLKGKPEHTQKEIKTDVAERTQNIVEGKDLEINDSKNVAPPNA